MYKAIKIANAGILRKIVEKSINCEVYDREIKYYIVEINGHKLKKHLKLDWGFTGHTPNSADIFNFKNRTFRFFDYYENI